MAYDQGLAHRVLELLNEQSSVEEKKMFGGLAFMVAGHMCCGIIGAGLMVRIGPDKYNDALRDPHAREMDFTGKAFKGFVYVAKAGLEDDLVLEAWIQRALFHIRTLPEK